ncbi:MAG: TetR/AcrR family transcriptional regulator [Syntrophales bacterium]|nr:TetR/AcrR family transcriptional regulator [Syntrophales bacterium]
MGIAERRQREKDARIKHIQNCAAAVFYKKGYGETTMDEIAKTAELSKAAIYLYFKSKEDLYYSIIEPALSRLARRLIRIASDRREPAEATVRKIISATNELYEKDYDAYHLLSRYSAAEYVKLLPKAKLEHLKELMRSNLRQMEAAVRKGIAQGIFEAVDARLISVILWNCFMGVIQYQENRMEPGKTDYRKKTIDATVELILKGLRKL